MNKIASTSNQDAKDILSQIDTAPRRTTDLLRSKASKCAPDILETRQHHATPSAPIAFNRFLSNPTHQERRSLQQKDRIGRDSTLSEGIEPPSSANRRAWRVRTKTNGPGVASCQLCGPCHPDVPGCVAYQDAHIMPLDLEGLLISRHVVDGVCGWCL